MPAPGEKFGPYDIVAKLGAGGMGEVYKALDPKLNRDVAIKVLPASLANDADYLARFQREAQTLAALSHPNIATIFGLEGRGIVMEFVEGQTLKGPLPLPEALAISRQIAEALEAAHDKNIIHRDLKPGNVMLTPDGVVKVLDFGLAKAVSERPTTTGPDSPTLTLRATEAGLILGTAGYMSPEQAAGKPVDRRADIWSFGVVLYELLTGSRLFDGETVSHTLASVLKDEIDLTKIPEGSVRDLVRRCLDRNIKTRLQHIGEARIAIDNHAEKPAAPAATPSRLPWYIAAAAVLTAGAAWIVRPSAPVQTVVTEISPPDGGRFAPINNAGGSAISPDGRTVAFVAVDAKGATLLYVRPLDSLTARALPDTENAGRPFWSPDSKSLAFVAGGKLKRIDLAGGAPITLCDARNARGGSWNEAGEILFADIGAPLRRIPASGGTPSPVTQLNTSAFERAQYNPQFLPGGKQFIYLSMGASEIQGIYLGSLDGSTPTKLVQTANKAVYDPSSERLFYIQGQGKLMARKLSVNPPSLTGDPVVVAESVRGSGANGYSELSVSSTGTLLYGRSNAAGGLRFVWKDRSGKTVEPIGEPQAMERTFRLSPDGNQAAYTRGANVSIMDLTRGLGTQLSSSSGLVFVPTWTPDGKTIYFTTEEGIVRRSADGSGTDQIVVKAPGVGFIRSISPDGKSLLYGMNDITILPLAGKPLPTPYLDSKANETGAAFSPDGQWVAYASDESGRSEIYVQGFPERRGKSLISPSSGLAPAWRADGTEIFWIGPDLMLMAASIDLQAASVKVGKPEALFRVEEINGSYAPSRDGKRILVIESESGKTDYPLVVVQNWAARLGR